MMKCLCLVAVFVTGNVFAWGPDGHDIVGHIAELHLTTNAAKAVSELLNGTNAPVSARISDEAIANWADYVRRERSESAPWHFVDIPFAAESYDPERDCTNHQGCVVEAVSHFQQALSNREASTAERIEALKFLVHFVGDLHQPLHCAERNGDQGGNKCLVHWPRDQKPAKLHVVWDVLLIKRTLKETELSAMAYAEKLNKRITPEKEGAWQAGTPADWAWEAHRLAVTKVYATIPVEGPPHHLDEDYIKAGQEIVDEQLSKGGIRLARLLNEALGK